MPASGRFLLDTNIVIALLDGEKAVLSALEDASEIFISATAVGELFFGAAKSGRPAENRAKLEAFVAGRSIFLAISRMPANMGGLRKVFGIRKGQFPKTTSGWPRRRNATG